MIVLVGFMGAGKSTVGKLVAAELDLRFVDTDAEIERRAGRSIADIFTTDGENAFRALEREIVMEALAGTDGVVALGGGSLGDPDVRATLGNATVVHLDVSLDEALARAGGDASRPLLDDARSLHRSRASIYREQADITIATDGRSVEEVASEVVGRVRSGGGMRRITVALNERAYDVVVGRGLAARLGELLPPVQDAEKAFFVTHPGLADLARPALGSLQGAGLDAEVVLLPEGEMSKSVPEVAALYEHLARNNAHRHDLVVAFGGGVVSDVGGFVASTYARGMPLVNIPTTLLGQVDAAIGGKTGVNLPQGKNLVGTIYQPALVVCDVDLLDTCPVEEIRSGLAEVIKYGFIAEPDLLEYVGSKTSDLLGGDAESYLEVVGRSVAIKAGIVAEDERESDVRAHLNYGHTFAHAIELNENLGGIRHGEAVAVGMMAAAYLAHELERIDDQVVALHRRVLEAVGLPVTASLNLDDLEAAWRLDKKYRRGVRFVLLAGLGKPEAGVSVPRDALEKTIERLAL